MPTTLEEAKRINDIVNCYIEPRIMGAIVSDLFEEVGLTTKNYSLRKSLLMLNQLYHPDYMIPKKDIKRLILEYKDDPSLQNVSLDEYIGVSHHDYLDFVVGSYPDDSNTPRNNNS